MFTQISQIYFIGEFFVKCHLSRLFSIDKITAEI